MSKENNTQQSNSEEVDLGQLFNFIGRAFDRFFGFIGALINKLFLAFVWVIFFIQKHAIKLILVGILGFAFGFFKETTAKPNYKSSVIVKQNYIFGASLYNSISYYQDLLDNEDYEVLAEELSIDTTLILSVNNISIEPLVTENERLIEFNNYTNKLDSTIALGVDYGDFLDNVRDHVYATQLITINSKSNENFNQVFKAIIQTLNSNTFFTREREKDIRQLENREKAINKALVQSDSLKKMYKKILEFESQIKKEKASQTSITIEGSENKTKTKEYDLFINDIELRKTLVSIQREKEDKENILEIMSTTPSKGFIDSSIEVLGYKLNLKLFFSLFFPFIFFAVLLTLRLFKYLEKYKIEN